MIIFRDVKEGLGEGEREEHRDYIYTTHAQQERKMEEREEVMRTYLDVIPSVSPISLGIQISQL